MNITDPRAADYVAPYNRLPILIDEVGDYITRDGKKVTIHEIVDHSDDLSVTRFNCKGSVFVKTKHDRIKSVFNIWHESGYKTCTLDNPHDIVAKAY